MEVRLAELRNGDVSASNTQRSALRQTRKATRTMEYKLDRVSHEANAEYRQSAKYHVVQSDVNVLMCSSSKALTRFNNQLTKNSCLREELYTLHIEQARFQKLHSRLNKVRGHFTHSIYRLVPLFQPLALFLFSFDLFRVFVGTAGNPRENWGSYQSDICYLQCKVRFEI